VQFADDQDWLEHTLFHVRKDGRLDKRYDCCESHPTWPDGNERRVESVYFVRGTKVAKYKSRTDRLNNALDEIRNQIMEIEGLRDEITQWKEGMEGTNLENTQKYQDLEQCEQDLDTLIDDLNSAVDSTSPEFPGMY